MNNFLKSDNLFVISGPCVIESRDMIMEIAETVKEMTHRLGIDYIFKASFDKANRSSITSYRGPGLDEGLKILEEVKKNFDLPLTTDIHEPNQAKPVGEVVDILQIPAFLCRQTDLLVESAKTGKIVNIKKAQFLSHEDMVHAVKKVTDSGNNNVALTERGNIYGYGNLVVDFRNIIEMKKLGHPVIMDATHSTQRPGGASGVSGGNPEYAPYFAKNALICGADGLFFEVHPDPKTAKSDGTNMLRLDQFEKVLTECKEVYDLINN